MEDYIPFILIPIIAVGVRYRLKKKHDLTFIKKWTLSIGITSWIVTELVRSFYRPYVYANDIFDYYFADTIGNTFGTVTALFMILTLSGKGDQRDWNIFAIIIPGLIAYEFFNLPGNPYFDWNDIIATLIFGGMSFLMYSYLIKKFQKPLI